MSDENWTKSCNNETLTQLNGWQFQGAGGCYSHSLFVWSVILLFALPLPFFILHVFVFLTISVIVSG